MQSHRDPPRYNEVEVTNVQLYLAIGVPVLVNAAMFGLLVMYLTPAWKESTTGSTPWNVVSITGSTTCATFGWRNCIGSKKSSMPG